MNQTRKVFTRDFKQECIRLVIDQGHGVEQAAKAMSAGLSSMQLGFSDSARKYMALARKQKQSHLSSNVFKHLQPRIDSLNAITSC